MANDKNYQEAATEYGDHLRLARTAEDMGAHTTAQVHRQAADEVRQDLFGPDSQFGQ